MKKKIIALIAGALMALSASSAFAAFGDLELIRVYYDRNGAEIATDLGSVSSILATSGPQTFAGSFGTVPAATGFAVYFAVDRVEDGAGHANQLWVSGSTSTPTVINGTSTGMTGLKNGSTNVYSLYNSIATGNTATTTAANTSSFRSKLSATQGTLGNAINAATRMNTELSLANLATANTQTLYYWSNGLTTVAADKIGAAVASITTNADGSTTITSTSMATPIPAAAWLLGSGLMGLVGIRRKMKA